MLRVYLNDSDVKRLCRSVKYNKAKTVHCFYGTGCNGKSTVSNHLKALIPNIQVMHEWHSKKFTKNIVIVNSRSEDECEKIRIASEKQGYQYELYVFSNTFE